MVVVVMEGIDEQWWLAVVVVVVVGHSIACWLIVYSFRGACWREKRERGLGECKETLPSRCRRDRGIDCVCVRGVCVCV